MIIKQQVSIQPYLQYPQRTDKEVDHYANHTSTEKPVKIKQQHAGCALKLEDQNPRLSDGKNEIFSVGTGVPVAMKLEYIEPTTQFDIKAVKFPDISEEKPKFEQCHSPEPLIRNLNLSQKTSDVLTKKVQNRKERVKVRQWKYDQQHHNQNAKHLKAKMAKYYSENSERIKARQREYRRRNAERLKSMQREYRNQNSERLKAQQREYHRRNSERLKAQHREYHRRNAERINARHRRRRKDRQAENNPGHTNDSP